MIKIETFFEHVLAEAAARADLCPEDTIGESASERLARLDAAAAAFASALAGVNAEFARNGLPRITVVGRRKRRA